MASVPEVSNHGASLLTVVAVCGGVGALIDFALGKAGQKRVRETLEIWWLKVSYADLASFGRAEAGASALLLERLFGRLFSPRRLVVVLGIAALAALTWLFMPKAETAIGGLFTTMAGIIASIQLLSLSLAISITIWFCRKAEQLLPQRKVYGLLALVAVLALQYVAIETVRSAVDSLVYPLLRISAIVDAGFSVIADGVSR